MKIVTIVAAAVTLMAASPVLAPRLNADEWDQLTKMTFNQPVEIPGTVLPPGTYTFKLLDSQTNRNIVQIYNADNTRQIAMVLAIPDYKVHPSGKTAVMFEERPSGSPEAIKAWFYPGDQYGQEFVYPKKRAVQLAKEAKEPVLSMPDNLSLNMKKSVKSDKDEAVTALKKADVKAEKPTGEEVETSTVVNTPPQLAGK